MAWGGRLDKLVCMRSWKLLVRISSLLLRFPLNSSARRNGSTTMSYAFSPAKHRDCITLANRTKYKPKPHLWIGENFDYCNRWEDHGFRELTGFPNFDNSAPLAFCWPGLPTIRWILSTIRLDLHLLISVISDRFGFSYLQKERHHLKRPAQVQERFCSDTWVRGNPEHLRRSQEKTTLTGKAEGIWCQLHVQRLCAKDFCS